MTPARFARINRVLDLRQPDLHVVVENVHKPHNLAAIARSCDAVGALNVHAVSKNERMTVSQKAAMGTGKWLVLHHHSRSQDAFSVLKTQNVQLVAVSPTTRACDYRDLDYTIPTALVVGTELDGLRDDTIDACDHQVVIPMQGMVASLNVSVACALVLFEVQRQRQMAGLYAHPSINHEWRAQLLFQMCHPALADYCQRHQLDYPSLDNNGRVLGDLDVPSVKEKQSRV